MALVAASAVVDTRPASRSWTPTIKADSGLQQRQAARRRQRRGSRGSTQPRPLRPNEPIVFGYPQDRFTSHPNISSLMDEQRRTQSAIYSYSTPPLPDWVAEMAWTRANARAHRLSGGFDGESSIGMGSDAGRDSLSLSLIERPNCAPDGGVGMDHAALGMIELPTVIDKRLSMEWDVGKVPASRGQNLDERSFLAKCKMVQQYETVQKPAALALREQSMQASPTSTSRAASALAPAAVEHHPHPLNLDWSQDRIERIDRLSMPTPVRLRQVTQRRTKPPPAAMSSASAYSAHTVVNAARIYSSGHKGWQSRKTPYERNKQARREARERRARERAASEAIAAKEATIQPYPEEWEARIETLCREFREFPKADIVNGLLHFDGHAGKAARLLRGGISDTAFKTEPGKTKRSKPLAVQTSFIERPDAADGQSEPVADSDI